MKKLVVVFISAAILQACSNEQSNLVEENVAPSETPSFEKPEVDPTNLLTIQIGGMSCEMGCGGAIRKELYATNAVDEVTYDFKMGRDVNEARVAFDATKISEEEIIEVIEKINKNQFSVKEPVVSTISKEKTMDSDSKATSNNASNLSSENKSLSDQNMVSAIGQSIVGLVVKSLFVR